jgi:hypothetical protein
MIPPLEVSLHEIPLNRDVFACLRFVCVGLDRA